MQLFNAPYLRLLSSPLRLTLLATNLTPLQRTSIPKTGPHKSPAYVTSAGSPCMSHLRTVKSSVTVCGL
jgi:hypothetical protein